MRQLGILCAAALVALQENVSKLEADHKKAKTLAGEMISFFVMFIYIHTFLLIFITWLMFDIICILLRGA